MSAARDAALAALGMRHDMARGWWNDGLLIEDRDAVLVKVGLVNSDARKKWDQLSEFEREAIRPIYERTRRQYMRLRGQFQRIGAAGVA